MLTPVGHLNEGLNKHNMCTCNSLKMIKFLE